MGASLHASGQPHDFGDAPSGHLLLRPAPDTTPLYTHRAGSHQVAPLVRHDRLRRRERLGHVRKALQELEPLHRRPHLRVATGEGQGRVGLSEAAVRRDLALVKQHHPDLHVLGAVAKAQVLVDELGSKALTTFHLFTAGEPQPSVATAGS